MRLITPPEYLQKKRVSIHASVKDATLRLPLLILWHICFNPRICKRCDTITSICPSISLSFNPRICKRCDGLFKFIFLFFLSFNPRICKRCDFSPFFTFEGVTVSIHASVKDATSAHFSRLRGSQFQSTHL